MRVTPLAGRAILVSRHDLHDLAKVLEATAGTGINVYTHGELLPAHGYPELHKHPHLAGNYGGAWQDQQRDFTAFPGPIVMTSNCLIEPQPAYRNRIFTTGPVGWPASGTSTPPTFRWWSRPRGRCPASSLTHPRRPSPPVSPTAR